MAHQPGTVDILGVTTRTSTSNDRSCHSEECPIGAGTILPGQEYERVARLDNTIEFYHPSCFEREFGRRELYGE